MIVAGFVVACAGMSLQAWATWVELADVRQRVTIFRFGLPRRHVLIPWLVGFLLLPIGIWFASPRAPWALFAVVVAFYGANLVPRVVHNSRAARSRPGPPAEWLA